METPSLTKEEAVTFLSDVLQFENWNEELQNDKVEFVNHLMIKYQQKQPFQTLSLLSEDLNARKIPTWEEIKTAIFTKEGGLCHTLNTFIWMLLKALGYDVYLVMSNVVINEQCFKETFNHTLVIVRDLTVKGSLHVIDCGFVTPILNAIIIEDPAQDEDSLNEMMYHNGGKIFKYVKRGSNTYV
ncbi:unnamed protein product, partial [Owenia fusiformis]